MRLNEAKVNKSATLMSNFWKKNWLFYTNMTVESLLLQKKLGKRIRLNEAKVDKSAKHSCR